MQGEVIDGLIGLAAAHWLFAGHDENYEGVKRVALEMSAIIPDLPAVSSPATMGKEKRREKKGGKKGTRYTLFHRATKTDSPN